ncbi:MAG: carbohydrate-binding domain-containing protein [Muribaculaceae bacterium]|nr:carbohydrate-binding domain-containing protein [Muribaculaceae bacterium]
MTKVLRYSMLALVAFVMASCVNDDSDLNVLIQENPGRIIPPVIEFDYSDLDEGMDIIPSDPDDETYNDYWENSPWTTNVRVNYTAEGVKVTGTTTRVKATVEGGHVTVRSTASRVHITLSGECSDGSVKVYSDYKFKLTLNGLDLTNPHGAAINSQCRKTMYLNVAQGTANRLADGEGYITPPDEEDMKGTVFSEGQIVVSGNGSLDVYCNGGHHAIASDDYLRFRKGNKIKIESRSGNGIRAKDGVFIDGSVINVCSLKDAGKAINSKDRLAITGGRITAITTGAPVIDTELADTTSAAAVKCDSLMTMTGGTLRIKSMGEGGKGIKAKGNVVISGGSIEIVTTGIKDKASPKGVKCDGEFKIDAGRVYVYCAHTSPMHAATLTLAPGYKDYVSKSRLFSIEY